MFAIRSIRARDVVVLEQNHVGPELADLAVHLAHLALELHADLLAREGLVLLQQGPELAADALELDEDEVLGFFGHGAILAHGNGGPKPLPLPW